MVLDQTLREAIVPDEHRGFAQCHASTLVTLPDDQRLVAYFAGTREGTGDTAIWLSQRGKTGWAAPLTVVVEPGLAHWNPVLHWQRHEIPLVHIAPVSHAEKQWWQGLQQNALWESELNRVFQWDGVIQPAAWESAPGHIHLLMRSTHGFLYRSDSEDYGRHWSPAYATTVPNNNSGIDVVRMPDNTLVLACNPIGNNWGQRTPLSLLVSHDNGAHWETGWVIEQEEGEFSYPALTCNGNQLDVTYTWNRKNVVYCAVTWRKS